MPAGPTAPRSARPVERVGDGCQSFRVSESSALPQERGGTNGTGENVKAPAAVSSPPGRRRGTVADMVCSLSVVLGVVLVIVWVVPRDTGPERRPYDYGFALQRARAGATYPVLAPVGLPVGWRASAAVGGGPARGSTGWRMAFVTPSGRFAGLDQTDEDPATLLSRRGVDASGGVPVQVGARTWLQTRSERGETALWRREGPSTVLLTGDAPRQELETLAGSLQGG